MGTWAELPDGEGMLIKGKENLIILDPRYENPLGGYGKAKERRKKKALSRNG